MKQISIIAICFLIVLNLKSEAQQVFPTYVVVDGDTMENIQLNEAMVFARKSFNNDTSRYRYNQMKFYIKIVLPYALEAVKLYREIDSVANTLPSGKRRSYIKSREQEVKAKFGDKIRKLNSTQGKYLIKIINRQSGTTCYKIVAELHSELKAIYHQTWAKMNGINLNEKYDATANKDFERILTTLGY